MRIGYPQALLHNRHRSLFAYPSGKVSFRPLAELSLYRAQTLLPVFRKDRGIEYFRGVYCLGVKKVELIHAYNRPVLNHYPWVVDTEHAQRLFPKVGWLDSYKPAILSQFLASPWCRAILPWSQFCKRQFEMVFPEAIQAKITVVYPGVPVPKKKPPKVRGPLRFLFVGNDFLRKGGHWVLTSFETFCRKDRHSTLTVVSGNVPLKYQARLKSHPRITWCPHLSREQLFGQVYPKHQVFLFPTRYEAFGLAVLEALSHGLAVIASDIGAMPEMIEDRHDGWLVALKPRYHAVNRACFSAQADQAGSIFGLDRIERSMCNQLVAAMAFMKQHPRFLRQASARAQEKAKQNFSLNIQALRLQQVYEKALS